MNEEALSKHYPELTRCFSLNFHSHKHENMFPVEQQSVNIRVKYSWFSFVSFPDKTHSLSHLEPLLGFSAGLVCLLAF